jgi:DNA-binding XRE family transcriptional regulator
MPASRPMDELRKQAADLIIDHLKTTNVADVASDLGISRQAVYDIKKRKYCPSLSLVQKACEVWKVPFTYRGILIDSRSFGEKTGEPSPAVAKQANLFEAFGQLDNHSFEVIQTKPMGRALEITLRLTLPAQKTAGGQ